MFAFIKDCLVVGRAPVKLALKPLLYFCQGFEDFQTGGVAAFSVEVRSSTVMVVLLSVVGCVRVGGLSIKFKVLKCVI